MESRRQSTERVSREDAVEQVRMATDIADLVGSYVALRQAGRNLKGLCPFHKEKTPSFTVSRERQLFHCFGCGAGGDAFTFVMKHDGLSFPEALELLARRAGISLPEKRVSEGPDRAALVAAIREAVRFYRGCLRGPEGASARRYLQARGFTGRVLDMYYCGFAPASGHSLLDYASRKFPRDVLVQAGLIGSSQDGRLYDRFRGRVVLPILAASGDPIGFGGRAIEPGVEPKYLNSPETAVYKKGHVLFGLPQARAAIRRAGCALVVEGYFDAISMAAAGMAHVVAPCGTAWTADHARLLLRQAQRVVLVFDGDSAGEAAAWRALGATLPIHPDLGVAMLPEGKDPDDLVREGAVGVLRLAVTEPLTPVRFALESLARQGHSGHMLLERVAELLAGVGSELARETMLDEAAERTRVDAQVMRREVDRIRRARWRFERGRAELEAAPAKRPAVSRLLPIEEAIIRLAHSQPSLAGKLREASQGVPAVSGAVQAVLAWIEERSGEGIAPQSPELLRRLQSEIGDEVDTTFLIDEDEPEADEAFGRDLLARLLELTLEAAMAALGYEIRGLEATLHTLESEIGRLEGTEQKDHLQELRQRRAERQEHLGEKLLRKQELAREVARMREARHAATG